MRMAIRVAQEGKNVYGLLGIGGVVVDPVQECVVATACDYRAGGNLKVNEQEAKKRDYRRDKRGVDKTNTNLSLLPPRTMTPAHKIPHNILHHCALMCCREVGFLHVKQREALKQAQEGEEHEKKETVHSEGRGEHEDIVEGDKKEKEKEKKKEMEKERSREGPYLCTGLDLYITRYVKNVRSGCLERTDLDLE